MTDAVPLVCICIPTFNAGRTIRETLASILGQTYSNLVVRIVDNASTDDTLSVVGMFADARVAIYRNAINIGSEANFTRCIHLATGKYTAIYHADDIYEPEMVARQVEFLEKNARIGAVFTNASLIDEKGRKLGGHGIPKRAESENWCYDFQSIFRLVLEYSNFFICPSAMVRTQIYGREIREWRGELFKTSADLDVWFRILQTHPIGILPDRLIRYRISQKQGSAQLRARVSRADFFLVLDYYLSLTNIQNLLSPVDWRNFHRLERTDRMVRAVNLYLGDKGEEARCLIGGTLNRDAVLAAVSGFRGMASLLASALLHLLIFLRCPRLGKFVLLHMKRFANK